MRMISTAAAALLVLLPLGAHARQVRPGATPACQPWDRGAAARADG